MKFVMPMLMCVLLSAPALKLLVQSRSEEGGPERWAGLFFLFTAAGMPLRMMGVTLIQAGDPVGQTVNLAGHGFLFLSTFTLTVFTWRVFHPDSGAVRGFVFLLVALQVATTVFALATGAAHSEESNALVATNAMRVLPTIWACAESIRYWRLMKRRVGLGLADPVVANRFALWGVWTGAFAALPGVALVLRIVLPIVLADSAGQIDTHAVQDTVLGPLRVLMGVAALFGIVALTLSFFPPAWYLARVRSKLGGAPA